MCLGKRISKQEHYVSATRPLLSWVGQRSVCHCYAVYLTHDMGNGKVKGEAYLGSVTALVSSPGQSQSPVSGSLPGWFPPWSSVSHMPADSGSFCGLVRTFISKLHPFPLSFVSSPLPSLHLSFHLPAGSQFTHTYQSMHVMIYAVRAFRN